MTKTKKSAGSVFVWDIGIWKLEFIWNLVFGAWNFSFYCMFSCYHYHYHYHLDID